MGIIGKLYAIISAETSDWDKKVKKLGADAQHLGRQMSIKLTLPLLAIGAAVLKTGMDFEKSLKNAGSVVLATGEQMKQMEALARKMGAETVYSAKEAADAMYYMASAGWSVDTMLQALPDTLKLAAATQSDLAFTTDTLVAAMNVFGFKAKDTSRVVNAYAAAIALSQATLEKLSISMTYIGPIANGVGHSIEGTLAPLMALYNNGYEASMAGTSLRMALAALLDPTPEVTKALADMNLKVADVTPTANSFTDIVRKLGNAGATTAEIMKIFGVRAGPGMAALIKTGADAIAEYEKSITGTQYASEMMKIQNEALATSVKKLGNTIKELAIAFFKTVAPVIKEFIDNKLKPLIKGFSELSDEKKKTIIVIGLLVAALGPLLKLFGMLTSTVSNLPKLIAFIASPVGLVVAALGLLAYTILKIKKAVEDFSGKTLKDAIRATEESDKAAGRLVGFRQFLTGLDKTSAGYKKFAEALSKNDGDLKKTWEAFVAGRIKGTGDMLNLYAKQTKAAELQAEKDKIALEGLAELDARDKARKEAAILATTALAIANEGLAGSEDDVTFALNKINEALAKSKDLSASDRRELELKKEALERVQKAQREHAAWEERYASWRKSTGISSYQDERAAVAELQSFLATLTAEYKAGKMSAFMYAKATAAIKDAMDEVTGKKDEFAEFFESIGALGAKGELEEIAKLRDEMTMLDAAVGLGLMSWEEYRKKMGEAVDKMREYNRLLTMQYLPKPRDTSEFIKNAPKLPKVGPGGWLTGLEPSPKLEDKWAGVAESIAQYWNSAMSEMIESGINLADVLYHAWGALVAGASSLFSNLVKGLFKAGSKIAGPIGEIAGVIGGAIIGGIGKLLGIKSKAQKKKEAEEKAAKEEAARIKAVTTALAKYGAVSDDTAKKISDAKKTLGEHAAVSKYFAQVISDVGVKQSNVNKLWQRATEILQDMKKGAINAEDGVAILDEAFTALLEGTKKLGKEGSRAMVEFILAVRASGEEVASVTAYVLEQLDRIPNALMSLIVGFDEVGGSIEELGLIAVHSFNAMIASGLSWIEVVGKMSESLAALAKKYEELGVTASPALEELFKVVEITEAHKALFTAIEANREILEGLGNSGWLTAEILTVIANEALRYYAQLQEAGMTADQALRAMGPTLQLLHDYAKAYGIELDEATEALIAKGIEKGIIKEEPEDLTVMKDIRDTLHDIRDILRGGGKEGATLGDWKNEVDTYAGAGSRQAGRTYAGEGIAWKPQIAGLAETGPEAVLKLERLMGWGKGTTVVNVPKSDIKVEVRIGEEEIENFVVRTTQKNLNARNLQVPAECVT